MEQPVEHFHHRDAIDKPKPRRPGVVEGLRSATLTLFYGSTFKRGGYPRDVIEANPRADAGTPARELADYLAGFVDEPTFFHGSLVSESPLQDDGLSHYPEASFPNGAEARRSSPESHDDCSRTAPASLRA